MLSLSQKEKLLNWDLLVTPEETLNDTENTRHKEQVEFISVSFERRISPHMRWFFFFPPPPLLFISQHSCLLQYNAAVQRAVM